MLPGLGMALVVIILDQLSKFWIYKEFIQGARVALGNYFNLVKVFNTGVSFSLFNNYGNSGVWILCLISLTVCVGLLYWMYTEKDFNRKLCLGMIVGGALGNVIDRVHYGAVIDFLDFHIGNYHWPAFNVADSFICLGAIALIILELNDSYKKGTEKK